MTTLLTLVIYFPLFMLVSGLLRRFDLKYREAMSGPFTWPGWSSFLKAMGLGFCTYVPASWLANLIL